MMMMMMMMIVNLHRCSCKGALFLFDFNHSRYIPTDFVQNPKCEIPRKFVCYESRYLMRRTDGQLDTAKLVVTIHFANAPKNIS